MARLERLINLTATLLDADRLLSTEELRRRVPGYPDEESAFHRAFERDKETLRDMGVPIEIELVDPLEPNSHGYRVSKDAYYLRDPGLAPDELAALRLAASAVRLEGARGVEALWKLGGATSEQELAPPMASLPGSEQLPVLFSAVGERRTATFRYHGEDRTVDPFDLSFRNGHWYLGGRDHANDGRRTFRLDRFESRARPGPPGAFERPAVPPAAPAQPWEWGDEESVVASLVVDATHAGPAVELLGADAVRERHDDGSVVLAVSVTNRPAFRSFVLGFLDHAEVLGPAELRDDIVSWLRSLCRP